MRISFMCRARLAAYARVVAMSMLGAGLASATHVGPAPINNVLPLVSDAMFQPVPGANWVPAAEDITADPNAPPWIKRLMGFAAGEPNPLPMGTGASLKERANLGERNDAGPPWYQWTEMILTPGWGWLNGGAQTFPQGPNVSAVLSNNNKTITFTFPAPAAGQGNFLVTEKVIQCIDPNGCAQPTQQNPIRVAEWPTQVPEPCTLALLGLGLAPLAWRARKSAPS